MRTQRPELCLARLRPLTGRKRRGPGSGCVSAKWDLAAGRGGLAPAGGPVPLSVSVRQTESGSEEGDRTHAAWWFLLPVFVCFHDFIPGPQYWQQTGCN